MNTKLKKAAMKKARAEGWTLTSVLNLAAKSYVEGRLRLEILDPELAAGMDDERNGRTIPWEQVKREIEERQMKVR